MKNLSCILSAALLLSLTVACNKDNKPFVPSSAKDFEGTVWKMKDNDLLYYIAFFADGARLYSLNSSSKRVEHQYRGAYTFTDGTIFLGTDECEIAPPGTSIFVKTYYIGPVVGEEMTLHLANASGVLVSTDFSVTFIKQKKFDINNLRSIYDPDAVDLGLVVNGKSVKWASWNVGATKEYEYGEYYAWGETATKKDYSWSTYKLANGKQNKLTKYCPEDKTVSLAFWDYNAKPDGPDGETVLLPEDDIVLMDKRISSKWRMPTQAEVNALVALWKDPGYEHKTEKSNGVDGYRITRKSTGATIFFPAAGKYVGTEEGSSAGYSACFWSAELNLTSPNTAYALSVQPGQADCLSTDRYCGLTIRPVCD